MKKFFSFLVVILASVGITASAQRAGEFNLSSDDDINHSGAFVNVGLGVATGDIDTDLGIDLDLGYRYHFGSGFNWEIKAGLESLSTTASPEDFLDFRIVTGARYNTAKIAAGKSLYVNFDLGYYLNTKYTDEDGFAYEIGAGVNLSRTVALGLAWQGNKGDGYHYGMFGVKLGLNF